MTLCEKCIHEKVCAERDCYDEADERALTFCSDHKPKSRFVELPCEVGKKIYRLSPKGEIWEWQIAVIEIYPDEIALVDDSDNYIEPEEIGKTVFLSREDAEKALKGVKNAEN